MTTPDERNADAKLKIKLGSVAHAATSAYALFETFLFMLPNELRKDLAKKYRGEGFLESIENEEAS